MAVEFYQPIGPNRCVIGPGPDVVSSAELNLTSPSTKCAYSFVVPEAKTLTGFDVFFSPYSGGNFGTITVRIETNVSGSVYPSGSLATGGAEETFTLVASETQRTITLANSVTVSAHTRYWVVLTRNTTDSTNYPKVILQAPGNSYEGYCNNFFTVLSTSSTTWTSGINLTSIGCPVILRFSDGSIAGMFVVRTPVFVPYTYRIYSTTNKIKVRFKVSDYFFSDGLVIGVRQESTTPRAMSFILKDDSDNTLETMNLDISCTKISSGGERALFLLFPAKRWFVPNKEYRLYCSSVDSASATAVSITLSSEVQPLGMVAASSQQQMFSQIVDYTSTGDSGYAVLTGAKANMALSVISVGNSQGVGLLHMDSSVRDGSSGYSLRLRAASEIEEYHFVRRYVAPAAKTGYSIKMRRNSSYIPAIQSVKLYKNGSQIGTTLSADTSANDTFYTYSLSGLSISANDVIEIHYITKLSSNAALGEDYAWFDTEAFS